MKAYTDCTEVREDLSAYLDDEMLPEERERMDAHLRGCADCLREIDAHKRVNDVYGRVGAKSAPADFESRVKAAVRSGGPVVDFQARRTPRWAGPLVAAAAAAIVVIGGVVVLENQQRGLPEPAAVQMEVAALQKAEADVASSDVAVSEPTEGSWDSFTRSAEGARESTDVPEVPKDDSNKEWDRFVRAADATAPAGAAPAEDEFRGRADERSIREGLIESVPETLAAAPPTSAPAPVEPEADRAAVLGDPQSLSASRADELQDAAEDAERNNEEAKALFQDQTQRAQAVGEIVSRQRLRSFRVGADGTWYESGYDNQPLTPLPRESDTLRELMKQYPEFDWNKLIKRSARQVFQLDNAWYDLEALPEQE